jgi:hypothetical protein
MQISPAEQAGFLTFLFTWLVSLGGAFAVAGGSWPSGAVVVVGLISAAIAGIVAYAHVAGVQLPTANAGAPSTVAGPPKTGP